MAEIRWTIVASAGSTPAVTAADFDAALPYTGPHGPAGVKGEPGAKGLRGLRGGDGSQATAGRSTPPPVTAALAEHLAPVIEARWRPSIWKHPCDAFLIRYSPESQPAIRLHEDISYFSCSIRLRKACAGGELLFPRQNFSDTLIPDGWLLCWPSRITHPHQVRPVRKGSRVSLVVWTPEREP